MTADDRRPVTRRRPSSRQEARPVRWQRVAAPRRSSISSALLWLFPLAVDALHGAPARTATRPRTATCRSPTHLNLDNYFDAWDAGDIPQFFLNTLIIADPGGHHHAAGSRRCSRSSVSRFSFRFNLFLLMLFTAGNLLPPQVIITPLYRMYLRCRCRRR